MHPNLMEMRMFGTVATIKIKEGKGAEFEKIATELVNKVNENEKGCLLYQVYHDRIPDARDFVLAVHDSVLDPDRGCSRTRLQPGFHVLGGRLRVSADADLHNDQLHRLTRQS
jgi:hypothetical protein